MSIKVGIIGMGSMGRIRKKFLDLHPGFELVAITDMNEKIATQYPGTPFYPSWTNLLDAKLDAVFVCTFNDVIPDIVCAALKKGLHVFSEKPPGKTLQCIERMISTHQEVSHKVLKFGFNHRFHGSVMYAKELIESGRYGKIFWCRGFYGKSGDNQFETSWRSDKDKAGAGILLDQGIHMVDLLIHFLGPITGIKSEVMNYHWNIPVEDNAFALLKAASGATALLHSSATHWRNRFSLEIGLEGALIHLDGILSNSMTYAPEKVLIYEKNLNPTDHKVGEPPAIEKVFEGDKSWEFEIEDFFQAITFKKAPKCGTTEDALNVMNVIYGVYENAK